MIADLADLTVELGFGADVTGGSYFVLNDPIKGKLNDATYLLAPATVFVDVSDYVSAVVTSRGRERDLDEYSTGTATIVLNDTTRRFDPSYGSSPYYGMLTPGRRVQIGWMGVPIFRGYIDDLSNTYEAGNRMSRVTIECVDGLAILANQELDEIAPAYSGDLVGARISRVLDRTEVTFPATRSIDTGNATLGATTLGDNALSYLQACNRAEAGYLFISADGTFTFRNRLSTFNNLSSTVVLSDTRANGVPYLTVTQRSASDVLYTRVTGESETTSVVVTATSASTTDYFVRTLALGTLFNLDDSQTQALVDFYLERFSSTEQRFQAAKFNMVALTQAQVSVLVGLDLTDVVTVERSPLGIGSAIQRLSIVDGIQHRITEGSWETELTFANADTRSLLVLNDTTYGVLGSNRLAF